jgi:hypothetical protein
VSWPVSRKAVNSAFVNGAPESRDELIKYAAALDCTVSFAQLARWHRAGLLPRPSQQPLGRGRGTATLYPHGTSAQLVALCQIKEEERRLDRVAFRLWWEGFSVDSGVIKSHLTAASAPMEERLRRSVANGETVKGIDGALKRALGQRRAESIAATMEHPPADAKAMSTVLPWESSPSDMPSLDDFGELIGRAMTQRLSGAPIADVIARASEDELIQARERVRSLLALMQAVAAPLSWLYGKNGSLFQLMNRLTASLTPPDLAGLVAVALAFGPEVRPDLMTAIDAGIEPPALAHELQKILIIREHVPGATEVFTPMAIRALLRNKEAASRYRPKIEQFIAENRDEIETAWPHAG